MYRKVKDAGKYKEIERTDGVSTSEIINRMLCIAKTDFNYVRKELSLHQLPKYNDMLLNLPEDKNARMPTGNFLSAIHIKKKNPKEVYIFVFFMVQYNTLPLFKTLFLNEYNFFFYRTPIELKLEKN